MSGGVLPMEGLRVLDHGHVWAGPLLAEMFADMGADVIRVQAPGRFSGISMAGRGSLAAGPAAPDDPRAYQGWDRGKRSVSLDLAHPDGKRLYLALVAKSDVIVENFAPRVLPGLGLGYEVLREANPRIVLASLSAAGATPGPWRELLTYGPSLAALYGVKSVQGYAGEAQPREDTADLDPTAAAHAFVAVCAVLEYRERTGRGQHIDIAQGEATIQRIAEPVMDYLLNGRVAGPQGNRYPGVAPHGVYPAVGEDRWIAIVARDEREWGALIEVAGEAGGRLREARFATLAGRLAAQDALDEAIGAWTERRDAGALTAALQAAGVPAYPVMDPPALLADPNYGVLRECHVRVETAHGIGRDQIYQGIPWKLTKTPGVIRLPVAATGEHNAEVYGELLGLDAAELERLRAAGVI
ncbi:MAG: CoA transferase [Chloroflexi bacterium]|nr:CoA transferase [Chloroflexota bacterium]